MIDIEIFSPDNLWAILPRTLDLVVRNHQLIKAEPPDPAAFITTRGLSRMEGTQMSGRIGNVGVLPVRGAFYWTESYQRLAADFTAMVEAPDIDTIVLDVNSPGGVVHGVEELAKIIAESEKPVVAHVGGMAASAGYWIASAAGEIVMSRTASAGSIGVMATYIDWSKFDEKVGIQEINIISSQSPLKNAPPTTKEGLEAIQARVDALAAEFIAAVATNRGVDDTTVMTEFGQGDLLVGERAVSAGLANRLGSFDELLSELSKPTQKELFMTTKLKAGLYRVATDEADPVAVLIDAAFLRENHPDLVGQIEQAAKAAALEGAPDVDAAVKADRERTSAILAHAEAKGRQELAAELASTGMSVEQAAKVLAKSPKSTGFMDAMSQFSPQVDGEEVDGGGQPQGSVPNAANIFANRRKSGSAAA